MVARFATPEQRNLYETVLARLRELGYGDGLVREEYSFEDWFSSRLGQAPELRTVDAAAFGRTPLSYDSACFSVSVTDDAQSAASVNRNRALGAPLAFVVEPKRVLLWKVQATATVANRPLVFAPNELEGAFREHATEWNPTSLLRAKNIGPAGPRQLDFVDMGLIPALEQNILDKLDPLLQDTFFTALTSYQQRHTLAGRPDWLFRLVFRVLAGKVMADRGLTGFERFQSNPEANDLLAAVNNHFGDNPDLNADTETRQLVVDRFWDAFSFRNMSVSVLSFVWENTLVDTAVRKELSIHGTPPGVARYIVKQLGFEDIPEGRCVLEPCCGGATFLLAAMRRLVDFMPPHYTDQERHEHLRTRLAGFDVDPFGLEVARDCLMLADYPASNHWELHQEDVFNPPTKASKYHEYLKRAAVVLCNPPYGKFAAKDKKEYAAQTVFKPIQLLARVLDTIPADCTLGFVLPHTLLSGQSYPEIRRRVAERFGSVEVVNLPDQDVFSTAEYETTLLIAREPRPRTTRTTVRHGKVGKRDWPDFNRLGVVPIESTQVKTNAEAEISLAVPELQVAWQHLRDHPTVKQAARVGRGVEWNIPHRKNAHILLSDEPKEGYVLGIPPAAKTELYSFLRPALKYLNFDPLYRLYKAFDLPWGQPKVLMNARRKGRGPWRVAAFADETGGLTCYDTFTALWPAQDWSPIVLAAAMNGPVANAYIATHTVERNVPNWVLKGIPLPRLDAKQKRRIEQLVHEYVGLADGSQEPVDETRTAERLLLEIDAAVLEGYKLPPRLERQLLDYFNGEGERRKVEHTFGDYYPTDFTATLPLRMYLSMAFQKSTAKNLIAAAPAVTDPDLIAALEEVE